MGRGHFYDGTDPSDNFTFVFVLDFDSNDDMSAIAGKGFMVSVNETGTFAGHKLIGDFDISKSGSNYTGSFHLRNYAPNEVHNLGIVNTGGGVVQEATDPIHNGLDLVSFTSGGPMPTPTDISTDFEEIAWGKDPVKNITGGPLGTNGTMDLSRNAALYLNIIVVPSLWVHIQGTIACNQYINDTYAVTGDDGSPYGELWQLSLLDLPYQEVPVGGFIQENGYTFTPFGLPNPSSECYAGTESFALAAVLIATTVGNAVQTSTDQVFGLYPHPKVESVVPNSGMPNTTMDVTITGRYFLRADDFAPNTGSVSFGPNIMVNSYTINTNDPINNTITANITIADGAAIGSRDVTLNSSFGYLNGNGTGPYKSGTLVDGFTVSVVPIKATVVNPPNKIETIQIPQEYCTWAEGGFNITIENLIWQNVTINGFVFGNAIPNTQVIFPDLPFDLTAKGTPGANITVRWRIRVHSSAEPGVYEREFKLIWSYVDPIPPHELVSGSVTVDPTIKLVKPVGGIVEFPQIEEPGTAIPDLSDHNYSALARIIVGAIVGTITLISAVWYVRRRRTKAI